MVLVLQLVLRPRGIMFCANTHARIATGDIRDGADKKSPREESVATDPTTMKINRDAGEDPGQQGGMPKPRAELLEPGLGGIGGGSACERARPWAIQAFVKPKGPLAWYDVGDAYLNAVLGLR